MTTNFSRSGSSPPRRNINRPLGSVRNTVQDSRPAQAPPKPDTSVLVHDCFDQQGGESKPTPCGCAQRISRLDAQSLIKRAKADLLIFLHLGKQKRNPDSIVLRREYVRARISKSKIDGNRLLPAILKPGNKISFKKGVIRSQKTGAAIELEFERTDAHYWSTVLVELGLSASAGKFLKDAAHGMGVAASLTTLEPFQMAPVTMEDGLNPEINAVFAGTIAERKEGARRSRAKVGAAGYARDSDDRKSDQHDFSGQMHSAPDLAERVTSDGKIVNEICDDPRELPILLDEIAGESEESGAG